MQKFADRIQPSLKYLAIFSAGGSAGALFMSNASEKRPRFATESASEKAVSDSQAKETLPLPESVAETLARSEKKLRKLQRNAQERIQWKATDQQMLGLTPRLWMEVFDQKHRYATCLYAYWRRFQLSDSNENFWEWLDHGMGSLIDLPEAPRRLLDEWQVIYLNREQQPLFRVIIDPTTGRFHWEADGKPVTLPPPQIKRSEMTSRECAVADLLEQSLSKIDRRDGMLAAAREEVEAAIAAGEEPTEQRISAITAPLIKESLLCQLRDPFFAERHDAASTPLGHRHHWTMRSLPETLLPGIGWQEVLTAINHDQGREMNPPMKTGDKRLRQAVFVWDRFGPVYCGSKIRGILHHSSFVRGHCVKVAGGIVINDGWLMELSPHSGHYQPGLEEVEEMIEDWRSKGVDFSLVKIKPILKAG